MRGSGLLVLAGCLAFAGCSAPLAATPTASVRATDHQGRALTSHHSSWFAWSQVPPIHLPVGAAGLDRPRSPSTPVGLR